MQRRLGWRFHRSLSIPSVIEPLSDGQRYARRVLAIAPNNIVAYWPLWEIGGNIAHDRSPQGNNGTYTGVILNQPGIGDSRASPFFDGVNDFVNTYSAALNADFDGDEGTISVWARVANVGVWTDGVSREIVRFLGDANNDIFIQRTGAPNNTLGCYRRAGGVNKGRFPVSTTTDWFHVVMTWSVTSDQLRVFFNTIESLPAQVGLNVFGSALNANQTLIGAGSQVPVQVWHGWIAHLAVWNIPLSPAQIERLYVV